MGNTTFQAEKLESKSSHKKVAVWVKKDFLIPKERLCPLLSFLSEDDQKPEARFWNPLRKLSRMDIEINFFDHLEEAGNLVVTPHSMRVFGLQNRLKEVVNFNRKLLASGRRVVSFALAWEYKPIKGEILFASGTYHSREDSIPCPLWLYDWDHATVEIEKPEQIAVGFIGNIEYSNRLNKIVKHIPVPRYIQNYLVQSPAFRSQQKISENMAFRQVFGRWVRTKTAQHLQAAPDIDFHYIGRKKAFFEMSKEEQQQARTDYLNNLNEVPYRLIMRGDENSAFSLYEAMSAGRIPVIIHTGMRLPEISGMDWEDFSIIQPFDKISELADRLKTFHNNLSNEEFKEKCRLSRRAFESLSPDSFFTEVILPLLKTLEYQAKYNIPLSILT